MSKKSRGKGRPPAAAVVPVGRKKGTIPGEAVTGCLNKGERANEVGVPRGRGSAASELQKEAPESAAGFNDAFKLVLRTIRFSPPMVSPVTRG
jgi:hypothetical protein